MKNTDSTETTEDCESENRGLYDLTVPPVGAEILRRIEHEKRVTLASLCGLHTFRNVSRSTIKHHLSQLVARGYARRHGRGKGTWYTL